MRIARRISGDDGAKPRCCAALFLILAVAAPAPRAIAQQTALERMAAPHLVRQIDATAGETVHVLGKVTLLFLENDQPVELESNDPVMTPTAQVSAPPDLDVKILSLTATPTMVRIAHGAVATPPSGSELVMARGIVVTCELSIAAAADAQPHEEPIKIHLREVEDLAKQTQIPGWKAGEPQFTFAVKIWGSQAELAADLDAAKRRSELEIDPADQASDEAAAARAASSAKLEKEWAETDRRAPIIDAIAGVLILAALAGYCYLAATTHKRYGRVIILNNETVPAVCMCCGGAATTTRRRTFCWVESDHRGMEATKVTPGIIFTLVDLLVWAWLRVTIYFYTRRRADIDIPLCRRHRHRFLTHSAWLVAALFLALPVVGFAGAVIADSFLPKWDILVDWLAFFAAGTLWALLPIRILGGRIRASGISQSGTALSGISRRFIRVCTQAHSPAIASALSKPEATASAADRLRDMTS